MGPGPARLDHRARAVAFAPASGGDPHRIQDRGGGPLGVRRALVLVAGVALFAPSTLGAHDVDVTSVARVFLDEIGERRYLLSIVDLQVPPITDPRGVLPADCEPVEDPGLRVVSGFAFECASPLD